MAPEAIPWMRLPVTGVFQRKYPPGKRVCVIRIQHFNRVLKNNGPMVVFFVHEMNGDAGDFCPVIEHRLVDFLTVKALASESRKQRRVNIDYPVGVSGKNLGGGFFSYIRPAQ